MADELINLAHEAGDALVQDPNVITTDELQDVQEMRSQLEPIVNEQDDEEILITEDENNSVLTSSPIDNESEMSEEPQASLGSVISKFLITCGINLVLPFFNGMMLGFGEIVAHELGFKYGWSGARVYPSHRVRVRKSEYL